MNYRITHITRYSYHGAVSLCHNESKLTPKNMEGQICNSSIMSVDPTPVMITERTDFFGNTVHYFSVEKPHEELVVTTVSHVSREYRNPQLTFSEMESWEMIREKIKNFDSEFSEVREYIFDSSLITVSSEIESYALESFLPGRTLYEAVQDLMCRIHVDFEFDPGFTDVTTPLSEVMKARKGVCQDFAQLGIACVRAMGLPARYVSGYIETIAPPGKERLVGADASHAWFSVYIPGMGWSDFDPTNNQPAGPQHLTLAWGRDYSDVVPLKGIIFSSGLQKLSISVDVLNLDRG